MPEEMRKKRKSIQKVDKLKASKNENETNFEFGIILEKTTNKSKTFSRNNFFKSTHILKQEQKFSDLTINILNSPALRKAIKKPIRISKFLGKKF